MSYNLVSKKLQNDMINCSKMLEQKIDEMLSQNFSDSRLIEAMRYCVLSSGKRIRPFLVINCAKIFDVPSEKALNTAIAIECIHTYSLIHDDLPAMDDDDFRRGKLSCHKKFDEATAILAGDALLTYAFEILSEPSTHHDPEIRCQLISNIAKSSGFNGMVGGQMIDLESSNRQVLSHEMAKLQNLKTGKLFLSCVECGAILGNASSCQKKALRNFAKDIGLAFQIRDDILDYCDNDNYNDINNKKNGIVNTIGLSASKQRLELLKSQAINHLSIFDDKAETLVDLAHFIVIRDR